MRTATYMCDYCSMAHAFPESDKREKYLCPDCGHEMWYWTSSDVDDETGLVVENYTDQTREEASCKVSMQFKPTVECPYCHSTDTRKISFISKAGHYALFGIFSMSRNSKEWHCNQCGSEF